MYGFASSPRFLRPLLLADAASCLGCGALQVAFTDAMAQWLHLPSALLSGTGWFLLAYAALVVWVATRRAVPRVAVRLLVVGNIAWGLACVALLLAGPLQPSPWGVCYVLLQATTVFVLAELQWFCLRRLPRAELAAA